ncbi:MAG: Eco57I restriction-modification methylase domain-containing protein, partial [Rhodoplanes sp.]
MWAEMCRRSLAESGIHCFHWELAFPQVFLEQPGAEAGFDVVIGNPPYDVLSEKESGPHVAPLKKFISQDASLAPSRLGKNNLYKVFICRALGLLREGGSLSFIVPMPLLGDEQASGVRKVLLKQGTFQQIHAFPQKDNPARLVFYDAKLATALFVYQKGEIDGPHSAFVSAVHPAQSITSDSPSLRLDASSVALYDPSNMTIVSCAQEDLDLAVAITRGSGIGRL